MTFSSIVEGRTTSLCSDFLHSIDDLAGGYLHSVDRDTEDPYWGVTDATGFLFDFTSDAVNEEAGIDNSD